MSLLKKYGSMSSAQHAYDNAVNPADEVVNPWEQVSEDELEAIQADFFAGEDCELFGIEFDLGMQDFDEVCAKWGELLQDDEWWLTVVETPYQEKYWQAKNETWDRACDIIDSKLLSA